MRYNYTYGVALECGGKVFTVTEVCGGKIGFPKGKKEYNETERECAFREFHEEVGMRLDSIKDKVPLGVVRITNRLVIFRYSISQKVKDVLDSIIESHSCDEIQGWGWISPQEVYAQNIIKGYKTKYNFSFRRFVRKRCLDIL